MIVHLPAVTQNLHASSTGVSPAGNLGDAHHLDSAMVSTVHSGAPDNLIPIRVVQPEDGDEDEAMLDEKKIDETIISTLTPARISPIGSDTHTTSSTSTTSTDLDDKRRKAKIILSLIHDHCKNAIEETVRVTHHALDEAEQAECQAKNSAAAKQRVDEGVGKVRKILEKFRQCEEIQRVQSCIQREKSSKRISRLRFCVRRLKGFSVHVKKIRKTRIKQQIKKERLRYKFLGDHMERTDRHLKRMPELDGHLSDALGDMQESLAADELVYEQKMSYAKDHQREVDVWKDLLLSIEGARI